MLTVKGGEIMYHQGGSRAEMRRLKIVPPVAFNQERLNLTEGGLLADRSRNPPSAGPLSYPAGADLRAEPCCLRDSRKRIDVEGTPRYFDATAWDSNSGSLQRTRVRDSRRPKAFWRNEIVRVAHTTNVEGSKPYPVLLVRLDRDACNNCAQGVMDMKGAATPQPA